MIKNGKLSNFLDFAKSQSDRGTKRRCEEKRDRDNRWFSIFHFCFLNFHLSLLTEDKIVYLNFNEQCSSEFCSILKNNLYL